MIAISLGAVHQGPLPARWTAVLASLVFLIGGHSSAEAYRFLTLGPDTAFSFPTVAHPNPWDPEVWGPGRTLSFALLDSPEWTALASDRSEVERRIEEVMGAWTAVESADIRWEVSEIVQDLDALDEKSWIGLTGGWGGSTTTTFKRQESGQWYAVSVGVQIGAQTLEDSARFREVLLHELGHAVGLNHASVYANVKRPARVPDGLLSSQWQFDPIMSYGNRGQLDWRTMITEDDRVGISLARPASAWLESTGWIRGIATLQGGGPAGLVHVWALRLREDGSLTGGVGGFANARGEFVIAGLAPGRYALLIRSLKLPSAHPRLIHWEFAAIRDRLWAVPVEVRAGRQTGLGPIVLVRGGGFVGE